MPELKNNFTQGIMNKDLDDRLVPNGQYRNALNVQVATSEGSDIGTIQNILGNVSVTDFPPGLFADLGICLATIADEKNNKLYYFVQQKDVFEFTGTESLDQDFSFTRDLIVEYTPGNLTTQSDGTLQPVFIDIHSAFSYLNPNPTTSNYSIKTNYVLRIPHSGQEHANVIKAGMEVNITDVTVGGTSVSHNVISTSSTSVGGETWVEIELDKPPNFTPTVDTVFVFTAPKVLFPWNPSQTLNHSNQITGINIIDDLLFWTDNVGEPKKINIKDCKNGTHIFPATPPALIPTCLAHKQLIIPPSIASNPTAVLYGQKAVEEKHITVIKKSPNKPPKINLYSDRVDGLNYSGLCKITNPDLGGANSSILTSSGNPHPVETDFSSYNIGDTLYLKIESDLGGNTNFRLNTWNTFGFSQNTNIVIKEYSEDGTVPSVPITNYRIKGTIVPWESLTGAELNSFGGVPPLFAPVKVAIKITDIVGHPPEASLQTNELLYVVDKFIESDKLFEFKFPRFAYRWKYKDGEYSSFSPFSEIAFLPGNFDFHPRKGYNLGMTNRIKTLDIKDFYHPQETPEDVVEIELLFKDEQSTNIYVIETLKSSDVVRSGGNNYREKNHWHYNTYHLSSEIIQAIVPSNQLLRPWDNVPRKALAQEIIGNRVVYGNYLQNFDLQDSTYNNLPYSFAGGGISLMAVTNSNIPFNYATKSVKSLREYQLGVVFSDKYDRQTPVISSSSASYYNEKENSWKSTRFSVEFNNSYPVNMDRFKFFIKETSDEYYNLAMDRYYDAEDGNIWLSFPSSDRNKLDIDTFLILKKGLDISLNVDSSAKYKIIAIENEAPDFVKTNKQLIASETHILANNDLFGSGMIGAPSLNNDEFEMNYAPFYMTSGADLHAQQVNDTLFVEFTETGSSEVSERYEVTSLTCDFNESSANVSTAKYYFKLAKVFGDDIAFISDDDSGLNSTKIENGAQFRVYRHRVENKPEFDGRFFVKILLDDVFKKHIKNISDSEEKEYKVVASRKIWKLPDFTDPIWNSATPSVGFDYLNRAANLKAPNKFKFKSWFQEYKFRDGSGAGYLEEGWESPTYLEFGVPGQGAHCSTANGWTMYYGCQWNSGLNSGAGGWQKHPSFKGFNSKKPPAYWFIDEAPWVGWRQTNHLIARFVNNSTSIMNPSYRGQDAGTNNYTSNGLTPAVSTDRWQMELGFGGIWSNDWKWRETTQEDGVDPASNFIDNSALANTIASTSTNDNLSWYETIHEFFNIGKVGGNIKHVGEEDIVQRLVPGQLIRWREDPSKTIYTIESIDEQQRIRYRRNDEINTIGCSALGDCGDRIAEWGGSPAPVAWDSNSWAHEGFAGALGPNPEGLIDIASNIDNRKGASEGINTGFTNPANFTKRYRTTLSPQIVWDPVNITSTNNIISNGYKISITTPTAGNTCLSCSSSDPANNFKLVLDTLIGSDVAYGNVSIAPGMVLTEYTDNTTSAATTPIQSMLIKTIDYDSATGQYHLGMCGSSKFHLSNENFIPKVNTTLVFEQPTMNGFSPQFIENYHYVKNIETDLLLDAVGYTLELVEVIDPPQELPEDPAVWETEPKESVDLEIYYEASSSIPMLASHESMLGILGPSLTIDNVMTVGSTTIINEYTNNLIYSHSYNSGIIDELVLHLNWDSSSAGPNGEFCVDPSVGCFDANGSFVSSIHAQWSTSPYNPSELFIASNGVNIIIPVLDLGTGGTFSPSPVSTINGAYTPTGYSGQWSNNITISRNLFLSARFDLTWHNCYAFGNGVESNRIRDNFNLTYIKNGVKASTTLAEQYQEEHRKHGLIYSGLYNSIAGVNSLNQFIQAEKITKDVNPSYGSIQKLHTRDSDLVTLCEDKVLRILANKDAVFNADGNPNLTATENVLGQTIPFSGEYGISTNPESFASENYRAYFADRTRGTVLRLSKDGLTPISDNGMRDWFRDRMKQETLQIGSSPSPNESTNILGSYDDRQQEYNITFGTSFIDSVQFTSVGQNPNIHLLANSQAQDPDPLYSKGPITLSFKESSRGWVSFKSFVPEQAISCNNEYFTFLSGRIWKHHVPIWDVASGEVTNYNSFYDVFYNSSVNVLLNEAPGVVKSFKTLNYEGSQTKTTVNDQDDQYYNLNAKDGWYVSKINTDLEVGSLKEFINKEGKWFNYLKGEPIKTGSEDGSLISGFDADSFAIQGLGYQTAAPVTGAMIGCTDPLAFNYDDNAGIDCGNCCIPVIPGCMYLNSPNYDPTANTDDGSCYTLGCTDPLALNYNVNVILDDGSCAYPTWGCMDATAFNYNPNAIYDDGSCFPVISGCMDPLSFNYNNNIPFSGNVQVDVNTPCCTLCDGTDNNNCCTSVVLGCIEPTACNFDPSANTDDGTCQLCGDTGTDVDNFDGAQCNTGCLYCVDDFSPFSQINQGVDFVEIEWGSPSGLGHAVAYTFDIYWEEDGNPSNNGTNNILANSPGLVNTHTISGLNINTTYNITITSVCSNSQSAGITLQADTQSGYYGCTDNTGTNTSMGAAGMTPISGYTWGACNYDSTATIDDGSCEYTSCAGCTDTGYIEYNASFTQPSPIVAVALGYCSTLIVRGCTDPLASNYNPLANVDDGSCCLITGCMDSCATNYNPLACNPCPNTGSGGYVNDCCTYGLLCDGEEFLSINGASSFPAPINTPSAGDLNGNGHIVGSAEPIVPQGYYDSLIAMWENGPLPTKTCHWLKYYTSDANVAVTSGGNLLNPGANGSTFPTWNAQGPISFTDTGKILFESSDISKGPNGDIDNSQAAFWTSFDGASSGIYQQIESVTGNEYSIRVVVDNYLSPMQPTLHLTTDNSFTIMICDGDYVETDTTTHTNYNNLALNPFTTAGPIVKGCIFLESNNLYRHYLNVGALGGVWAYTNPVTSVGFSAHMPDGMQWSIDPGANCPSAGNPSGIIPCSGGSNVWVGHNVNDYTRQVEMKLYWQGIGSNDIVYINYNSGKEFYNDSGVRTNISSRGLWDNSVINHSCAIAEVSLIEILDESNPCKPIPNNKIASPGESTKQQRAKLINTSVTKSKN